MRSIFVLLVIGVFLTACGKTESITPDSLTGVWVEKSTRQDTLIFNLDRYGKSLPNSILVMRGKVVNASGSLVPKIGSGFWSYQLKLDSISVISTLSSSLRQSSYVFRRDGDQIVLGNFFERGFNQPATAIRTLVRLP